jgi:hypothetical protein
MTEELTDEEIAYVKDNNLIQAIRSVRDRLNLDLVLAKKFVEDRARALGWVPWNERPEAIRALLRRTRPATAPALFGGVVLSINKEEGEAEIQVDDGARGAFVILRLPKGIEIGDFVNITVELMKRDG